MKVTERACNKCKEMKPLDGGFYWCLAAYAYLGDQ